MVDLCERNICTGDMMKQTGLKIFVLLAIGIACGWVVIAALSAPPSPQSQVFVYCDADFRDPCEKAATDFKLQNFGEINFRFGAATTLFPQIRIANSGDLYIADQSAIDEAHKHGVIREVIPIAKQTPVIAVRPGNLKKIRSLNDLFRDDIRVAITTSVGMRMRMVMGERWNQFEKNIAVIKPTVAEIASALSLGTVDCAIIWSSTVLQSEGLEAISAPDLAVDEVISVAVLSTAKDPSAALRYARFLAAPEHGNRIFEERGFHVLKGDGWSAEPNLVLYSGSVNRLAIEALLTRFAAREGIKITTVFNGCGVLCATMKTNSSSLNNQCPDLYYACDLCFVPPVAEHFPEVILLTETEIGLVVKKGNPLGIMTPKDLGKVGLRVGLCNTKQSTLGYMTSGILRELNLTDEVQKNVVVEVPTADFLINQMRVGSLDAAIVYSVNAIPQKEHLDYIRIDHKGALAIQPFSISKSSPRRQLGERLLNFFRDNRDHFEKAGFTWRGDDKLTKSADIQIPEWLKSK